MFSRRGHSFPGAIPSPGVVLLRLLGRYSFRTRSMRSVFEKWHQHCVSIVLEGLGCSLPANTNMCIAFVQRRPSTLAHIVQMFYKRLCLLGGFGICITRLLYQPRGQWQVADLL